MEKCKDTVAEALQICGPERLEWEDRAKGLANECRLLERLAQRNDWFMTERHCSTMATLCEQALWRLT